LSNYLHRYLRTLRYPYKSLCQPRQPHRPRPMCRLYQRYGLAHWRRSMSSPRGLGPQRSRQFRNPSKRPSKGSLPESLPYRGFDIVGGDIRCFSTAPPSCTKQNSFGRLPRSARSSANFFSGWPAGIKKPWTLTITSGRGKVVRKPIDVDTYFLGVSRGKSKRFHAVKIGQCRRGTLETRVRNLATGTPDKITILGFVRGASAERKFHRRFKGFHIRREWYKPAPEILNLIRQLSEVSFLVEEVERKHSHKM
jgi:hypothetical protein